VVVGGRVEIWATRLKGDSDTRRAAVFGVVGEPVQGIKAEVESARQRIARVAGVSPDAVKITVQFGS
jgi:hypothetical protein